MKDANGKKYTNEKYPKVNTDYIINNPNFDYWISENDKYYKIQEDELKSN